MRPIVEDLTPPVDPDLGGRLHAGGGDQATLGAALTTASKEQ